MRLLDRIAKAREGLYVSRPVLNADAWAKWAEKHGVPNPVPAEKMHVTVIASRTNVVCKPAIGVLQVFSTQGSIGFLGLDESVMVFLWNDWCLWDRHDFLRGRGAVSDWPEYRPHITLSMDAKGFELSDAAVAEMPPSFLLGAEVHAPFNPSPALKKAHAGEAVVLEDAAAEAAQVELGKQAVAPTMTTYDLQTLNMIAAGQPVLKGAVEALDGKVAFATAPAQHTGIIQRSAEEDRLVYGFASVSIAKAAGGYVVDSHKHKITTKAVRKLLHGLMRGQRAGKLLHQGTKKTDIVEGLVFDADVWKALGDYFETIGECTADQAAVFKAMTFEGCLMGFHCGDDEMWTFAKSHDFELSIGAEEATLQEIKPDA